MRVAHHTTVEAPAEAVWESIGDPRTYPRYLRDVTRWEPVPVQAGGRPRYRIDVRVGGIELGGRVELTSVVPGSEIAWRSVDGIEHHGRWLVEEGADGRSTVTLELAYHAPRGMLGTLADGVALPLLRRGVHESLARLKAEVERAPPAGPGTIQKLAALARDGMYGADVLARTGLARPARPDRVTGAALALRRWDASLAGGYAVAAALHPHDAAIVDERGTLSFRELHHRTNALARALRDIGVAPGDSVAIVCRNHRGFVESAVAASKLGADALFVNTGLAAPQLRAVVRRERPAVVVCDDEFRGALAIRALRRVIAWHDRPVGRARTLDGLIAGGDERDLPPPPSHGRIVLLTSGTTGVPKGAARSENASLRAGIELLHRIPLHARETTFIASPLFHAWGYANLGLAIALSSTVVLRRRFDPEATLAALAAQRATALVVVPTMLRRILELPRPVRHRHDTGTLRIVASSGSPLPGPLATRFMDEFGDVLYNLYGSTEVSWVAIATPSDLRAAPGTAGRPPYRTRVAIYDELRRPLQAGCSGRIFAGNDMTFDGYTDGRTRQLVDGLMGTGDLGHMDDAGRLFVDAREDDMIVSGGENVFPSEVESLLAAHAGVAEVAVVGVDDERFGRRLKAYVEVEGGAPPSEQALKDLVRATLAPFKVPREIAIVDRLPRNETGKVVTRELAAPTEAPG